MTSSLHSLRRAAPALPASGASALPAVLAAIVVVTGLARLAAAFERLTPRYLPDEFLYSRLARSIGQGDGVTILGEPSSFPALLEPLVTAALWTTGNAEVAYRLTQSLHAVAMAAAAVPIYVLARRLGLPSWSAVSAVAISAVAPGLLYIGYVTADALGYFLALSALAVGVRALETGGRWSQAGFLALAGLAISARLQYVVLIAAFVIAAVVLERGHVARAVRNSAVVMATLGIALLAAILAGPSVLGRYESVTSFGLSWETGRWLASTTLLLTIGAGVVLVPGATAWLGATLARPSPGKGGRSAFAALASATTVCLLLATAVISVDTGSERFLERYLIVLVPILTLGFFCWIDEGRPARYAAAGIAATMVVLAALVPLAGYAEGQGRADSPTLLAVSRLSEEIGVGSASLVAALLVTVAALVAIALASSHRVSAHFATVAALVLLVQLSVGAHAGDVTSSQRFQVFNFERAPNWVDASGARDVMLVQSPYSGSLSAMTTAFWNSSVTQASSLGKTAIDRFDGLGEPVRLAPDGTLLTSGGAPVERPVLFATSGTAAAFADDVDVVKDRTFALVSPTEHVRFAGLGEGVRADGTLAPKGRVAAFPTSDGLCSSATVRLTVPAGGPAVTIRVREASRTRSITALPGDVETIRVTSLATRGRSIDYTGLVAGSNGQQAFVRSIALARFTATAAPCAIAEKG